MNKPAGEPRVGRLAAAGQQLRAFGLGRIDEAHDAVELALRYDRPEVVVLEPRRADRQRFRQLAPVRLTTSSCSEACTNTREVELQDWPCRFMFMPLMAASCRLLGIGIGENDDRILAAEFEADALEAGRRLLAMIRPVGTDPTKPMRRTSGWRTSAEPTLPSPVMMLTTPAGNMPSHNSPSRRLESGACSEPLITTVLPAASGAAAFSAQNRNG